MTKIYGKENIQQIHWEQYHNGEEVKSYFKRMIEERPDVYVKNVSAEIYLMEIDDLLIPLTKTKPSKQNSYVVSPFTHYILYAIEELGELEKPFLEWILKQFLRIFALWMKLGKSDDVVIVNNWALSTNLYEELSKEQVEEMVRLLKKQFPDRVILFRSLTDRLHESIISELRELNCLFLPSRSVYIFFPEEFDTFSRDQRKTIRRDEKFLRKSGYYIDDIDRSEMPRALELYNQLYLEKYSYFNPQFTLEFLLNAYENDLFRFKVIRKDEEIAGVVGSVIRNGVITSPIFGYDLTLPKEEGLYRLCSFIEMEYSLNRGFTAHRSAGAGTFKRNRGAQNHIEYSAVITDHLPFRRRWIWKLLDLLLTKIGVRLLKKFNL